jgi:RNA polymerase sigma-70 factor (ECF subfamily)
MPQRTDVHTDEELCQRFLQGEGDALQHIVERFGSILVRFAFRFTRNQDDAEDIAQETLIRFHRNLPKLDLSRPIRPWLFHVCANLCRNLAARRKAILFSELENEESDSERGILDTLEDEGSSPHEDTQRSEHSRIVREALGHLPQKYQVVLSLFYFDELTYEEIAASLSLPLNTIRTHIHRGKLLLKNLLIQRGFTFP